MPRMVLESAESSLTSRLDLSPKLRCTLQHLGGLGVVQAECVEPLQLVKYVPGQYYRPDQHLKP